ncbi:MAG: hypothetical protein M5U26_22075 [Planctomycetota bacterium]|nr:hypothetical protein [Planctomycetota bacterium]
MRSLSIALPAGLCLALLLAGCGGGEKPEPAAGPKTTRADLEKAMFAAEAKLKVSLDAKGAGGGIYSPRAALKQAVGLLNLPQAAGDTGEPVVAFLFELPPQPSSVVMTLDESKKIIRLDGYLDDVKKPATTKDVRY